MKKSKYEALADLLTAQPACTREVTLSFHQVEELLGAKLPESAFTYREWWGNQADTSNRPQAKAWMKAGFEVDAVTQDKSNGSVRFRRTR